MARTAGVHTLLADSMERVHRSPTEWMQFLSFHARFYRYNTSNAALIYAQRPEATACATMNFWNKRLNRWIRRGSHGIRLLQPDGESIRYVFDVADTTGPPGTLPKIWNPMKLMCALALRGCLHPMWIRSCMNCSVPIAI